MLKIILIRHGKTAWNGEWKLQGHSNVELSPEGIAEAELLAANFPILTIDAIYSSDLKRAKSTAEILSKRFNLPVHTTPELRETNFGDWEGRTLAEMKIADPANYENFFANPEALKINNAESFSQVQQRAMTAIKKIIAAHQNGNIIVVAHGAINRTVLCSILDIPLKKMWALSQFNTAVNIIRFEDEIFTVDLINGTAHLGQSFS